MYRKVPDPKCAASWMIAEWIYFCKQHPDQVIDMFSPPETNLLSVPLKCTYPWVATILASSIMDSFCLFLNFITDTCSKYSSVSGCFPSTSYLWVFDETSDAVVHSFSFLCSIPLNEYTVVSWPILCLLLVKHLDCFQVEAITNNMAMEILVQIFFVCSCILFCSVYVQELTFWFTGLTYIQLQ